MRKIISLLLCAVLLTVLAACVSVPSFADTTRVTDELDALTDAEEKSLDEHLAEAEQRCGVKFRVLIRTVTNVTEEDLRRSVGVESDDVVILLIEDGGWVIDYEMFTLGDVYDDISDEDADDILWDNTVYSIKNGNFYEGAVRFTRLTADTIVENRRSALTTVITVSSIIAAVSAAVAVIWVTVVYKTKLKSRIYPVDDYAGLRLDLSADEFVNSFVTCTKISSSAGSSRGGGGGRSGGSRGRR